MIWGVNGWMKDGWKSWLWINVRLDNEISGSDRGIDEWMNRGGWDGEWTAKWDDESFVNGGERTGPCDEWTNKGMCLED